MSFIFLNYISRLVATKSEDIYFGWETFRCDEKIEFKFKNNIAHKAKVTFKCESEEYIETLNKYVYVNILKMHIPSTEIEFNKMNEVLNNSGIIVNKNNTRLLIEMPAEKYFYLMNNKTTTMEREEIKTVLENAGYKVK